MLCLHFYDEIIHWKLEYDDLRRHNKALTSKEDIDDKYYGEVFKVDGIPFKCSFDLNSKLYGEPGFNALSFHAFLSKNVEKMKVYIESYCKQNRAEHKVNTSFYNSSHFFLSAFGGDEESEELQAEWVNSTHFMKLDWRDWESLDFRYHIEILSIAYSDRSDYFKQIRMRRKSRFRWYVDGALMAECRTAIASQMFFSDTFDDENNNWCLRLQPMGRDLTLQMDQRHVVVSLELLRKRGGRRRRRYVGG